MGRLFQCGAGKNLIIGHPIQLSLAAQSHEVGYEFRYGEYRGKLAGKIVVDPSNPIGPDGSGGFKKIIPQDQSSGQILAALIPPGAKFVKAFGSLSARSLKSGTRHAPEPYVLFYASDDRDAGNAVADLIKASGFAPMRVGGINQSIRVEVFGDLHELGKLGKLATAKEAAALV